jgi:hypothetical protein
MAETVGLIAGGAGLASLAVQILENALVLAEFYSAVREAPEEISGILEEINILATVLVEFSRIQPSMRRRSASADADFTDATIRIQAHAIRHCKAASEGLGVIVSELNIGSEVPAQAVLPVDCIEDEKAREAAPKAGKSKIDTRACSGTLPSVS